MQNVRHINFERPLKRTLWIGNFQAGKTSGAVKEAFKRQKAHPHVISVFIAFGTNVNKENQEEHIKTIYGSEVSLINSKQALRAFKLRLQKDQLRFYKSSIVISILGHHSSLEVLQNILSTKSDFEFDIWLDESDSYSKDFNHQRVSVRKDNLIDSMSRLEYHKVREIICITATPFTELVSNTDFHEIEHKRPGQGYKGLEEIVDNYSIPIDSKDIRLFNENYELSKEMEQFFLDQSEIRGAVTLVSTISSIPAHKEQAWEIANLLCTQTTNEFLVVAFNSDSDGDKYFDMEGSFSARSRGLRRNLSPLEELWLIAADYNHVFIVGYGMLDRSVTLKDGWNYKTISGMLFSTGKDSCLAATLQRAARVCGYQDTYPRLLTDKVDDLLLGVEEWPRMVSLTEKYKNSVRRRAALLDIEDLWFKNVFGRYRNNGIRPKSLASTPSVIKETKYEVENLDFPVINKMKIINEDGLSEGVLAELEEGIKATSGTKLHKQIMEKMPGGTRILNVLSTRDRDLTSMHLPNQNVQDNYRDILYHWDKKLKQLRLSLQPHMLYRGKFALQHVINQKFYGYKSKGSFRLQS